MRSINAQIESDVQIIRGWGSSIYEPSQWVNIIKCAKKKVKAYIVNKVQQYELYHLKKYQ